MTEPAAPESPHAEEMVTLVVPMPLAEYERVMEAADATRQYRSAFIRERLLSSPPPPPVAAIELGTTGLILRDASGTRIAEQQVFHAETGSTLITLGAWPSELALDKAALDHLGALYGRAGRRLCFPADAVEPRVPRRPPAA